MRVGLDADGVVYDFIGTYFDFEARVLGVDPRTQKRPSQFHLDVPEDIFFETCRKAVAAKWLFALGNPLPGARQAVRQLKKDGHEIHIKTARTIDEFGPLTEQNTYDWFLDWGMPYDSITFTKDKAKGPEVDIFLDDKVSTVDHLLSLGQDAWVMYEPPRLDQLDHPRLLRSWDEFLAIVEQKQ